LDALNHYLLSLPTKLLLLDWHLLDHRLPAENARILRAYLELNQLRSVKIRHNQYAPIDELRRLIGNGSVGLGYRLTLGMVNWLRYTLLPDRLLAGVPLVGGGDHFNPYSNTINVYSSDLGVLLHEAGHAKDYVRHEMPGTSFALLRLLPGIDLLQEAAASRDAIRFLHCIRDTDAELDAYRTLIPAYSTYIAGYLQGGLVATLPIVGVGHLSGRFRSWQRARSIAAISDEPHEDPTDFLPPWCENLTSS
jgi:hypothetical protein